MNDLNQGHTVSEDNICSTRESPNGLSSRYKNSPIGLSKMLLSFLLQNSMWNKFFVPSKQTENE